MTVEFPSDQGVFGISVAAELTGVHPQTLRDYEAKGLLVPARTTGGTRRFSHDDLDRIRRITTLLAAGINLAGARHVLELEHETEQLRAEVQALRDQTDQP
jgi:MerR family transcriptional regulator/heat shock protein HspR